MNILAILSRIKITEVVSQGMIHALPDLPPLSSKAKLKNSIGKHLEHLGLMKMGSWFRKEKCRYRKARVDHSLKIVGNKLTMFQAESAPVTDKITHDNQITINTSNLIQR